MMTKISMIHRIKNNNFDFTDNLYNCSLSEIKSISEITYKHILFCQNNLSILKPKIKYNYIDIAIATMLNALNDCYSNASSTLKRLSWEGIKSNLSQIFETEIINYRICLNAVKQTIDYEYIKEAGSQAQLSRTINLYQIIEDTNSFFTHLNIKRHKSNLEEKYGTMDKDWVQSFSTRVSNTIEYADIRSERHFIDILNHEGKKHLESVYKFGAGSINEVIRSIEINKIQDNELRISVRNFKVEAILKSLHNLRVTANKLNEYEDFINIDLYEPSMRCFFALFDLYDNVPKEKKSILWYKWNKVSPKTGGVKAFYKMFLSELN